MSYLDHATLGIGDFDRLERMTPTELPDAARVFTLAGGTMTIGGRVAYGTTVVGTWWTVARHDDGTLTATRSDGYARTYDPRDYPDHLMFVER